MQEVSSKALHPLFKPALRKGFTLEQMVAGTSVTVPVLRSKNGRMDWDDLCTIHRNLRACLSDDELVHIGGTLFRQRAVRFAFIIARLLLTPMGFYRWINTPRQGGGNQMFSCITPSFRQLSDSKCEVELALPEGYEVCRDFFLMTKGANIEMPKVLGYRAADVQLEQLPRGARYHITIPSRSPLLTRIRRAITFPFVARAAARELKEANETLVDRNEELEAARGALERQQVLLDTAYRIGQRIWGERDAAATATAIVESLAETAWFQRAALDITTSDATAKLGAEAGPAVHGTSRRLDLTRNQLVGGIELVLRESVDAAEADRLIELLAPTVALAIENAIYSSGLEKLVDERTRELREAQSARERFFGNVSHEFRTPLSLIMLAAGDIEARAGQVLDARSGQSLVTVRDSGRKLLRLVDELLLLAAGQEGKFAVHREPADLVSLVGQLAAAWRPAAEAAGLALSSSVPDALVASVDPVAIERVLSNLVSNAVKYTPKGGAIEIVLAAEADQLRISVLDNGAGIDPELAVRLFGRFERGVRDLETKGTGIGLSLVKQLVEAHDGTVAALPRAPHGTELRVMLPRVEVRDAVAPARGLKLDIAAAGPGIANGTKLGPEHGYGTIVVAEDNPALAEAVAGLLADKYTVIVGLDGQQALELVKEHEPHLLITDIDMPQMNGIELAKRFRDVAKDKLAPIIILSAVIDLGTRVAGLEAGAIDYVTKPFDPRELRARVDAQFRMRELALRLRRAEQLSTLGILTSGLAHELRNPANGIVNAIAPLTEILPPDFVKPGSGSGELIEVIGECAAQINFLSKQLLGFRGETQLDLADTKLSDLVNRAVSIVAPTAKGVALRTSIGADRDIACAPRLIVQALTNLLENGAQAVGPGGWVEVATWTNQNRVGIEVSDSGPGVPVLLRDRIFEPFFTTKDPGKGTGLGLPFARAIMTRHGGTLEVRDRQGKSSFVIELPAETLAEARASAYAAARAQR
ncbi:MAG TPA: ATP-binding protein [Kofleriaceae bacterium]